MSSNELSRDEFLLELAKCNLNLSPKHNWVENEGGLPEYIHSVACAILRTGKTVSQAIEISVGRVRDWAEGKGGVSPKTRAKAAAAIAEWDAKRAKSKGKSAKKKAELSNIGPATAKLLELCADEFSVDFVKREFLKNNPHFDVKSTWTRYLVVSDRDGNDYRVDYRVDDERPNDVGFGKPFKLTVEASNSAVNKVLELALSTEKRKKLPPSVFVFPKERRYPIDTPARARAALKLVGLHGTPEEKAKVKSAVKKRYPFIKVSD